MAITGGAGCAATAYRLAGCQQFDIPPATRAAQQTDNHDVKQDNRQNAHQAVSWMLTVAGDLIEQCCQ